MEITKRPIDILIYLDYGSAQLDSILSVDIFRAYILFAIFVVTRRPHSIRYSSMDYYVNTRYKTGEIANKEECFPHRKTNI